MAEPRITNRMSADAPIDGPRARPDEERADIEGEWFRYGPGWGRFEGGVSLTLRAGPRGVERIVPPAGEAHAWERELWARLIEIYVSPTGRSVRVWVDGEEVKS